MEKEVNACGSPRMQKNVLHLDDVQGHLYFVVGLRSNVSKHFCVCLRGSTGNPNSFSSLDGCYKKKKSANLLGWRCWIRTSSMFAWD